MNENRRPAVAPETLEGWAVLHEVYRVDWASWHRQKAEERLQSLNGLVSHLKEIATPPRGESAIFSLLGHKGDLLLLHFRPSLDELNEVELGFRNLPIFAHLEQTTSYLSFLELGLYEMTVKLHAQFLSEGLERESEEWETRWKEEMERQRERMEGRLFMGIPRDRYLCFYPMNKRRGEGKNWYGEPIEERQRMMRDHGLIGRKFSGRVQQIITGSIGFDDWEWGVYLFALDPLVFKKLIYEMRFDEASAGYAEFGPFYVGLRFDPQDLPHLFSGQLPKWKGE